MLILVASSSTDVLNPLSLSALETQIIILTQ